MSIGDFSSDIGLALTKSQEEELKQYARHLKMNGLIEASGHGPHWHPLQNFLEWRSKKQPRLDVEAEGSQRLPLAPAKRHPASENSELYESTTDKSTSRIMFPMQDFTNKDKRVVPPLQIQLTSKSDKENNNDTDHGPSSLTNFLPSETVSKGIEVPEEPLGLPFPTMDYALLSPLVLDEAGAWPWELNPQESEYFGILSTGQYLERDYLDLGPDVLTNLPSLSSRPPTWSTYRLPAYTPPLRNLAHGYELDDDLAVPVGLFEPDFYCSLP